MGLTESEPLDDERGEEAEETAVREPKERARFPEVADTFDGVGGRLRDDKERRNERYAERAREPESGLCEVRDDTCEDCCTQSA